MNTATVTIVTDNTAAFSGLEEEHGLSFYAAAAGVRVLFDTGQGAALPVNAAGWPECFHRRNRLCAFIPPRWLPVTEGLIPRRTSSSACPPKARPFYPVRTFLWSTARDRHMWRGRSG